MEFGNRLKRTRLDAGLTQLELAKMVHVGESTICAYEKGKREPKFEILEKLSNTLRVSVDYLLGRTNDSTPPNINAFYTPQEARLIENYRQSDNRGRRIIEDVAEGVNIKDDEAATKA